MSAFTRVFNALCPAMTWRVRRPTRQSVLLVGDVDPHPTRVGQLVLAGRTRREHRLAHVGFLRAPHRHRRQIAAATDDVSNGLLERVDAFDLETEMIRAGALN